MTEEEIELDKISEIINRINARYKDDGKANRGSEEPPVSRISTDSLELDYACGVGKDGIGGIPKGRMSRFWGGPSTGKSVKALHVIANAQKQDLVCAYYNAEKQFTDEFAEKQGVDTNKLIVVQTSIIEDIGEIIEGTLDDVDVHVIDSCSYAISRDELSVGLNEKELPMIRARRWSQQFAFINERFDRKRNVLLYIDQTRVKGAMGAFSSEGPPGGKLMEFASSLTLQFKKGDWLWYDKDGYLSDTRNTKQKTLSELSEADGHEVKVQVVKSRVSRPFRQANMLFDVNNLEFDHTSEYVKAAQFFNVVDGSPGWIKWDGKAMRPKEFRSIVEQDADLRARIYAAALAA